MLTRALEALIPVRQGERQLTFTLFLHSLFAVGAFLTGRSVRDALFLAHCDRATLAWMYVLSAAAVTLAGLAYGRLATRVRRDLMAFFTAVVFAALFFASWLVERTHATWAYVAIYVEVEVMGAMVLVQFWTLVNELFNAREAKRLYALIGSGGTMANILMGLVGAKVATAFGTPSLLLMCGGLMVATSGTAYAGGRLGRQRLFARAATGKQTAKRTGGAARVFGDDHLRTVALLAAITFFTTTLIDFQFKVVAADKLKGDDLAAYFGYFSAVVGGLALALQLFGTGRLLDRAGVIGSLAVLPVSIALGDVTLLAFATLWAAAVTKGADSLFRYSINDATTQILYLPVPSQVRVAAKAFVDGVIKPSAIGLAGVCLAAYRTYGGGDPYRLAALSLVLAVAWVSIVVGLRRRYIRSLKDNLKPKRLDLTHARRRVADAGTAAVIERALASSDEQEVLNALALLPHLEGLRVDDKVEALLTSPSTTVRAAALASFAQAADLRFANAAVRCFEDPDGGVRAAAVDAFCGMARDKAVRSVRPLLTDPDARVRAAAIAGMMRYGGLDGVLAAAGALQGLISHPDPVMRRHGAKVLGHIGVKNYYQPVLQLMSDADLTVRREAIAAAAALQSPEFVLPLIYRTAQVDTAREASTALAAYGGAIVPTLAKVLGNPAEEPTIRRAVARVLGRLGTSQAVEVIARQLDEADDELRDNVYRSLARAVKGRTVVLTNLSSVRRALQRELDRAWRCVHQAALLDLDGAGLAAAPRRGPGAARALLGSALDDKLRLVERRLFLLLAVLYPEADMEQIYAGIHDASGADAARRRGNAVELLDNLLERELKQRLLPLVEEQPRPERLRQVEGLYPLPQATAPQVLTALAKDEVAWVRACATWCLAEAAVPERDELLTAAAADQSPVVREIALRCLASHAPSRAHAVALTRLDDGAPFVRARARLIAQPAS